MANHAGNLRRPVSLAGFGGYPGEESPELPPGVDDRKVPGKLVRTRGAADQVPQQLVVLGVHGERCRGRVLPVGVIPKVREQDLDRLVYGKAGDVLGYEVLTYRPVDEPAQGRPGVDIGGAERRGDVIDCVRVGLVQPDALGRDVVGPRPDTGAGVTGCPVPGPGPERLQAGVRVGLAVVVIAPAAGEHAVEHFGVQVAPELGQRPGAATRVPPTMQ